MLLLLQLSLWAVRILARSRHALVLENLALRQQLASVMQGRRRPQLVTVDRLFWVALRELWPDWSKALAIVQPATVVPRWCPSLASVAYITDTSGQRPLERRGWGFGEAQRGAMGKCAPPRRRMPSSSRAVGELRWMQLNYRP